MVPTPDDDVPTVSGPRPDIAEAAKAAASKVAASTPPSSKSSGLTSTLPKLDAEPEQEDTTAVPRRASMPLAIPGKVDIREIDDQDEQTEVRSLAETVAVPTLPRGPASPAEDEPITTVAASPVAEMIRISPKSLMPGSMPASSSPPTEPDASHDDPPTRPGNIPGVAIPSEPAAGTYDPDDITSRNLGADYEDDSVTTQAPSPGHDETEGTTKKRSRPPLGGPPTMASAARRLPADEELESITAQAPALTKPMRASQPELEDDDLEELALEEDDLPENRTAVMANAPLLGKASPLKHGTLQGIAPSSPPASRKPTTAPMAATALARAEPARPGSNPNLNSDSGLRVARPEAKSGERASLGAIGLPDLSAGPDMHLAHAPTEHAFPSVVSSMSPIMPVGPAAQNPTMQVPAVEAGPRYGLIVAIVATISILFPLTLFFALRRSEPDPGADRGANTVDGTATPLSDDVGSRPTKAPRPTDSGRHR